MDNVSMRPCAKYSSKGMSITLRLSILHRSSGHGSLTHAPKIMARGTQGRRLCLGSKRAATRLRPLIHLFLS